MTGLISRAERRGLLERAPSPDDGRAVDVLLSRAGLDLAERLSAEVGQSLSVVTQGLTGTEQDRLQSLLERMLGAQALTVSALAARRSGS